MEIVKALNRLGYIDSPAKGDHIRLFKKLDGHPEGAVTLQTGVDGRHCGKSDVDRVRTDTKLTGRLWAQALNKKLPREDYEDHLRAMPRQDLVIRFFRDKVGPPPAKAKKGASPKRPSPRRQRRA